MRKIVLLALLLTSWSCWAQQSMTLGECIELAWKNNLQVKQAELNMEAAESALSSARMDLVPNLNAFATHNYNWGQRIDPFTNQFANTRVRSNSFGISSSVDLFNGFQNKNSIDAQEFSLASARFGVEDQKFQIAMAIATAYLTTLLNADLVTAANHQVDITSKQLDRVRKMVDAGAQNIGVQYDLEAQLGQDKSTLTQRRNAYMLSMIQLKQLMLLPAETELSLDRPALQIDTIHGLEKAETVYGYAASSMPNVKRAEYSLMSQEKRIHASKSGYYPSLTLSGSLGSGYSGLRTELVDNALRTVSFGDQVSDNFNQFVGLSLNVPVFNRWNIRNSVAQAEVNREIAALQLEQEKQTLRQDIESARADALAARELYISNQKALASAQKAFEFAETRFEAGAINVTDFNVSKNNLLIAEANMTRSQYDYIFKVKLLDYYMGKPLGDQNAAD